jgi:hypothetical protein
MVAVQSLLGSGSTFSALLPRQLTIDEITPARTGCLVTRRTNHPGCRRRARLSAVPTAHVFASRLRGGNRHNPGRCACAMPGALVSAITLDLIHPDGQGLDLVYAIRAGGPNISIPVVVISSPPEEGIAAGLPFPRKRHQTAHIGGSRRGAGADRRRSTILVLSNDPDNGRISPRSRISPDLRGGRPRWSVCPAEIPASVIVGPSMLSGRAVEGLSWANDQRRPYAPWRGRATECLPPSGPNSIFLCAQWSCPGRSKDCRCRANQS